MKKEYLAIIGVAFFILGYVMDLLAGPIYIPLQSPFDFLKQPIISTYPFTAASVGLKVTVIIIGILISISFIAEKQLAKGIFLVFLTALFELYSIQQIATGNRLISLPWSLGFAFSGILLLMPALIYVVVGLGRLLHRKITKEPYDTVTKDAQEPDI